MDGIITTKLTEFVVILQNLNLLKTPHYQDIPSNQEEAFSDTNENSTTI